MHVKAKKHLGQHFLNDDSISQDIANSLSLHGEYNSVIEVGPGTGALTKFLLSNEKYTTWVAEVDTESIAYLEKFYPQLHGRILNEDFLKMNFDKYFSGKFAVIGNFPYNISTQILFRVYENKERVPEVVGMFQKEVAERICRGPGSKEYGIMSVLLQAYYTCEYLFTVHEHVFTPPPKVKSGVIRLIRNDVVSLPCDEVFFKVVVKTAFNQRRKTLRNSIKQLNPTGLNHPLFDKRPEQLGVAEFVELTNFLTPAASA